MLQQMPELRGVIGMHEMAELVDYHVIDPAGRRLDDGPVEHQLSVAMAGAPARLQGVEIGAKALLADVRQLHRFPPAGRFRAQPRPGD